MGKQHKENKKSLEQKFNQAYKEFDEKIQQHLTIAREELASAVKLSEEAGLPFRSDMSRFASRTYTPESFYSKWGEDYQFMVAEKGLEPLEDEYGDPDEELHGWDYWSYSSMFC